MTQREAIERLKAIRARTRGKLDRQALAYAISDMEDWQALAYAISDMEDWLTDVSVDAVQRELAEAQK